MQEIVCTSQAELGAVPTDFDGRVIIKFGTPYNRAVINRRFKFPVVARGNSSVEARGNSSVEAWDSSSVEARGNSSVVAWENSSVEAWENSSVEARGNSRICRKSKNAKIVINGNAREVHSPQTVAEYAEFYDLPIGSETQTIKLYKAVHRQSGEDYFISDWDSTFRYVVGGTVTPNSFNANAEQECGAGINLAHKAWAVAYGQNWRDLAIIECECKCDEVLVPEFTDGKVRAKSAKVLREVPLEECGLLGQIIAKRMTKNEA